MMTGAWYHAVNHPKDATSLVGGARGSELLTGLLHELFEVGKSRRLGAGPYERYRKIFYLNTGNEVSDAVVFFQDLQHIDQLRFAFEQTPGDTSPDSATMPVGYVTGDFVAPVGIIDGVVPDDGTIAALTGELGLWIMQRIPDGLSPETGAIGRIRIAGDVAP